jgi:cystathionine gamma-synthase
VTQRYDETWALPTRLLHAGERTDPPVGVPTTTPIYTSVTYGHADAASYAAAFDDPAAYIYTRNGNPTVAALEQALHAAEGGRGAVALASGMAALHAAILAAATPRGETAPRLQTIVAARDMYGVTTALLDAFFRPQGAQIAYVDVTDQAAFTELLAAAQPEVVLVEQISNPLLKVIDVAALAQACRAVGARLVVDNTLATPILQRPLGLGADIVVHSATKYLGGHCSATAGVAAARTGILLDSLRRYATLLGPTLGPFEAHSIMLGLKTLALRVRAQCANAHAIASWLTQQPQVARVYYPGLPEHPQHVLAARDFGGLFGAMVAFELGAADAAERFLNALRLILPVTSLGDVYTLATAPALSSHRDLTPEQRAARGISPGLIRLSVGIEEVGDLLADLGQALQYAAVLAPS